MYRLFIKRLLDIVFSLLLIILLSPLMLLLSILIRIKLGGPVIFKQVRPGLHGALFQIWKFRTMLDARTRDGKLLTDAERLECLKNGVEVLSDEERLTPFGRFLRASSLDELPELFNILRGEMSFVGPRPLAAIYLPYYTEEEKHRHDVRPGLTGLAQVHGRNTASWEKRFEYDLIYVRDLSFFLDGKILFQTVVTVLRHSDIGQGDERPVAFHEYRQAQLDGQNPSKKLNQQAKGEQA